VILWQCWKCRMGTKNERKFSIKRQNDGQKVNEQKQVFEIFEPEKLAPHLFLFTLTTTAIGVWSGASPESRAEPTLQFWWSRANWVLGFLTGRPEMPLQTFTMSPASDPFPSFFPSGPCLTGLGVTERRQLTTCRLIGT
jgi:hypothetical protein